MKTCLCWWFPSEAFFLSLPHFWAPWLHVVRVAEKVSTSETTKKSKVSVPSIQAWYHYYETIMTSTKHHVSLLSAVWFSNQRKGLLLPFSICLAKMDRIDFKVSMEQLQFLRWRWWWWCWPSAGRHSSSTLWTSARLFGNAEHWLTRSLGRRLQTMCFCAH